ncbi:MAG: phosphatidylglycerol lysyltransferase domain-containing protein [Endomicrobium sp.]|nr:phosphatidylglycerol lysyltransferase domain-containing protein [Endomicrobium sp.]
MKKLLKYIFFIFLSSLFFIILIPFLCNQFKNLSYTGIINALKSISLFRVIIASFLAILYYLILGGYDIIAFKYINPKNSPNSKYILLTSFISNIFGNNIGYSMLLGGSLRYRLYSFCNVSIANITKVLFFSSITIWFGLLAIEGFIFLAYPFFLKETIDFKFKMIGLFSIIILVLYSLLHSKTIKVLKWTITFPNIKIITLQILLSVSDWFIASFIFYLFMPIGEILYFVTLKDFLMSQFIGIVSQAPGGIGFFEAFFTALVGRSLNELEIISRVLIYRIIFYFFPLLIAFVLYGSFEIKMFKRNFKKTTRIFGKTISSFMIQIIALSSFFISMIAMFFTWVSFNAARLEFITSILPMWIADLLHFLLSIAALGLLFISRALQLRITNAWSAACILVSFAIVLMLVIGESYFVLLLFTVLLITLLASKKYFYRDTSILNMTFSGLWFSAVVGVFILLACLGFFVNREDISSWMHLNVSFKNMLNSTTDAARFLRLTIGMGIIIFIVALEQILRNLFRNPVSFTKDDIKSIIDFSDYTYSFSALACDKTYVVNDKKDAFIMYAKLKGSWIVLGDPVGKCGNGNKNELLWKFKEMADASSAKLAFIDVSCQYLHIYNDIGLNTFKIGQEAKIILRDFNKETECFKYFCHVEKEIENTGFKYKMLGAEHFTLYKDIFSQIDREWGKNINYVERNFIPGKYDDSYMKDMNFAVLEKHGKIHAFSIIAKTKNKHEVSSGIIRYMKCDKNIFDYMISKNILWAKENGYELFDLGLAYFPSIDKGNKVVKYFAKMFMFAEHFNYNLLALREFKNRFCPIWRDKYAAIYPTNHIPVFVRSLAKLVSPTIKLSRKDVSL